MEFAEYQSNLKSLENILGVSDISMWSCKHLAPYITRIIKYINLDLISEYGTDGEILDYIHEVERVWGEGAENIVHEKTEAWAKEVLGEELVEDYLSDRFVFCWSGIIGSLLERLRIQYWNILRPVDSGACSCCCRKGETQKDWEESYSSGVFPEDEETMPLISNSTNNRTDGKRCLCDGYIKNSL